MGIEHQVLLYVVSGLVAIIMFFLKAQVTKADRLQQDFNEHKLSDTERFAKLESRADETFRRFDKLDEKLDRLLENIK